MTSMTTYDRCKMDCRQLDRDNLFVQYVSGCLEPQIESELEEHILRCNQCQAVLEALLFAREDLQARAHIIRTQTQPSRIWARWVLVAVSSSCLLILGVTMYRFQRTRARQQAVSHLSAPEDFQENTRVDLSGPPSPTPSITNDVHKRNYNGLTKPPDIPQTGQQTPELEPGPLPLTPKDSGTKPSKPGQDAMPGEVAWSREQLSAIDSEILSKVALPNYTFSGIGKRRHSGGAGFPAGAVNLPPAIDSSSPAAADDLFQSAMLAYVEKRYADSETLLDAAIKIAPGAPEINFYLGISRLALGKPSEAIDPFRTVLAHQDRQYSQRAHFYLANAYMKLLRLPEADQELEKAASIPGPLRADARSELTNLRAILANSTESQKIDDTKNTH